MNDIPSFGSWLKQRRKEFGLTQPDLAQRIACSIDTIDKIESGKRRPSEHMAACLAQCLDISSNERQAFVEYARLKQPVSTETASPAHMPRLSIPQSDAGIPWRILENRR